MTLTPAWTKLSASSDNAGNHTVVKAIGSQVYFAGVDVTKYNYDGSTAWSNKWSNPNAIAVSADTRSDGSLVTVGLERWALEQSGFIAVSWTSALGLSSRQGMTAHREGHV